LDVCIVEQGKSLEKVRISGGGRCNVTNVEAEPLSLSSHYPRGHKELRGAFFREFSTADTFEWFESRGVPLKVEKDGRIFPQSDSSSSVIDCLQREARELDVELIEGRAVTQVNRVGENFDVVVKGEDRPMNSELLLLATGSSRTGWRIASGLGHTIVDPKPSLFTFKIPDNGNWKALAGISLQDCCCVLTAGGGAKFEQRGPMLITHWGVSGPAILKLSAWAARALGSNSYTAELNLDLCPQVPVEELTSEILRMKKLKNKAFSSLPLSMKETSFPRRLWGYLLSRQKIPEDARFSELKDKTLRKVALDCKRLALPVQGKGPFKEEFVTSGGVDLREVDLKTMRSKKINGLYFGGEVLNIDGETGGFNFQSAWTSGFLAGKDLAKRVS